MRPPPTMSSSEATPPSSALVTSIEGAVVPRFDFRVDFASGSRRGSTHAINQDALLCQPEIGLFAIADGMGGHAAGEVASRLTIEAIEGALSSGRAREIIERYALTPELEARRELYDLLSAAATAAHDAVREEGDRNPNRRGMGTTLDFVLLVRDRGFFAHVGDSRAYLLRPTATLQLTHDHAAYDSLRTSGKRVPTRLTRSPLTNSIGHRQRVVVDTLFVDLAAGDRIVLCTDGAIEAFEQERDFAQLCRTGESPADICDRVLRFAADHEASDDATVVALFVGERFARRRADAGLRAQDIATLRASPLLSGLPTSFVLSTLAAGVEVDLPEGAEVPAAVAGDRVAYVILDGLVELPSGRTLGSSGLVMVESLLDLAIRGKLPRVVERSRLLRIRHDDFNEVCGHNTQLAAELYKRIAHHLAQLLRNR
jgi:PPM family protein phosphatase